MLDTEHLKDMADKIDRVTPCNHISIALRDSAKEIEELREFTIWMTGCGYDFCQHECFVNQRDRLLKD